MATVLRLALLLCVWGALAQDFMTEGPEKLRRMEERLKALEETVQKLSILVEQLQKESKDLKPGQSVAQCKPLPTIPNGDVTEAPDGMSLTVECARFYKLIGPEHVTCVEGRWSKLPECKVAQCKPLPTIPNGAVHEAPDGMSLTVECAQFYQLIGPEQVVCVRGRWSKLPECKVAQCKPIPTIPNGDIHEAPDGMSLTVECARFYQLIGPEQVTCVRGRWSKLPECKTRCKLDPKMLHYYSERYMEHGTEESFFCDTFSRVHIKCEDGTAYYRGLIPVYKGRLAAAERLEYTTLQSDWKDL
ncbi:hypothetical protein NFI96_007546 [Prochilodus magdalenae]|nr:hypothetical protein NFI96_007546 [Prochilodus magdalenae]